MGFAVPAAIGAKVGRPDRMVWAIDGDGCFQMTAQELATATRRAHPGEDRDLEQRLPRHGAPVAAHVLRGALLRGLPLAGPAGLRRGGPRRWVASAFAWRAPRRSRRRSRRRTRSTTARSSSTSAPTRWSRCSRWCPPGRPTTTSSSTQSQRHSDAGGTAMSPDHGATARATACSRCSWRTRPACWPASPGLFARRGYNIFSLAVAPTDDERFSRISIVVDVESAPLEQVVAQLDKLINVVEIGELASRRGTRSRAPARERRGRRRATVAGHPARRRVRAAASSTSARTPSRSWSPARRS